MSWHENIPAGRNKNADTKELLYRFARHIRNTDKLPLHKWGVQGIDLLAKLREINPEKYERLVQ